MESRIRRAQNPTIRTYQELLGVGPQAAPDELKKAFRRMAFLYHPDRNSDPDAARHFEKIREAYETLMNPALVRLLNGQYLRGRLYGDCVEGLNISFGSFFGYRDFRGDDKTQAPAPRERRLGSKASAEKQTDVHADPQAANDRYRISSEMFSIDHDNSILDSPAFDALEVVYAGRFSGLDERRLRDASSDEEFLNLPWIVLNNHGIFSFLDGDFRKAQECYEGLNRRIPNNIIFTYRLGLCLLINGFRERRRNFIGILLPDRSKTSRGIELLKRAIALGDEREVGKQKCLLIRKTLAEALEKTGQRRQALRVWQEILRLDPLSQEAARKTQSRKESLDVKPSSALDRIFLPVGVN